jgi:hypothetical protein
LQASAAVRPAILKRIRRAAGKLRDAITPSRQTAAARPVSLWRTEYTGVLNGVQPGNCLAAVGAWYVAVAEKGQQAYTDDQIWAQNHCQ